MYEKFKAYFFAATWQIKFAIIFGAVIAIAGLVEFLGAF